MRHLLCVLLLLASPAYGAECGARGPGSVVVRYIFDGVLHRRWAVVADCAHPERPWVTEEVSQADAEIEAKAALETTPAVKAGANVILRKNEDGARIVLIATALEPGHTGDSIRVRVGSGAVLKGKIQGPGQVELIGPAKWNGQ
jgi:hypothetical protein